MGLYPIVCQVCGKTFMWFSGNAHNQLCEKCNEELNGKGEN